MRIPKEYNKCCLEIKATADWRKGWIDIQQQTCRHAPNKGNDAHTNQIGASCFTALRRPRRGETVGTVRATETEIDGETVDSTVA